MRQTDIKRAVKAARLPDESRLQMAIRLDIPYVTLRRMELVGLIHRNSILADAYLAKLTGSAAAIAAAKSEPKPEPVIP